MDEIIVFINDAPADDRQRAELFKLYDEHQIRLPGALKIRHFSLDYAKRRADENHV
jgi:hypothetical protein